MHHYHHHYYRYISDKQSQVFIKSRPLIFRIKSPRKQCCWLISLSCVWQVREGMWLKYQIFIQNVRKLRGPLSAIQKFLFATFFYPIFSKPFFGDFFGDFLLATFFPRYVLSDCFFGDFLLRLLPRAQSTVRAGKWRFQHHRQRRVIGLCLLRNPLWAKILSSWRRHNAVREHKEG